MPLLAYAVLPWVLLAAHRGLRDPAGWRWPAVVALAAAAGGGSVNFAHVLWIALAVAALLVYETATTRLAGRDARRFAVRAAGLSLLTTAWWWVPLAVQALYGADFQQFAEQHTTIWATTSMSESLRLLGFWVLYLGSGFGRLRPELGIAPDYLFSPAVVLASFGLPLLAFGGLRLTRGWRYAPFFGLLAVGALIVMAVGFPPGTPLRKAVTFASNEIRPAEVVRTTYKAAPLLALAMACLAGAALDALRRRVAARRPIVRSVARRAAARSRRSPASRWSRAAPSTRSSPTARCRPPGTGRWPTPTTPRPPEPRVLVLPGDLFALLPLGLHHGRRSRRR